MRAGVVYGPRDIKVEEVDMPSPGPGEVLLEVKAAGICGSDLHYHRSDAPSSPNGRIMGGHELSGLIIAVGEGVKHHQAKRGLEMLADRSPHFGILAPAGKPNDALLAAKPGHLALRVLNRRLDRPLLRFGPTEPASKVASDFSISNGLEGGSHRTMFVDQAANFIHQTRGEHLLYTVLNPPHQLLPRWCNPNKDETVAR